jgi:hypothetical protein
MQFQGPQDGRQGEGSMQSRRNAAFRFERGVRCALGALVLVVAFGQTAEARVETLRWSQSSAANVDGFRVHYGTSPGSYTTTINVGRPSPSSGVFSYNLTVGDNATVYVALTAYGAGFLDSFHSNEKVLAPSTTTPPPPPSAGTIWSQDFQTSSTGSSVQGWLDTGADSSLSEDDSLFAVVGGSGNRVLSTSSSASNVHSHYLSSGADDWSNYEVRGRMRISDTRGGVGVTIYSQFPAADSYYRLRADNGGAFEMEPHPSGAAVPCSPATTGVVPDANTWYRFRLRATPVSGANSIQVKVWADGSSEPPAWQSTCTDSRGSRPQKGSTGVWHTSPGTSQWDDIEVLQLGGTSGDAPPAPPVLLQIQ